MIGVQDATARYLPTSRREETLRLWALFGFFLLSLRLHLISPGERNVSRAYAKQTDRLLDGIRSDSRQQQGRRLFSGPYLSTLSAHRLSTVTPTEVFWMKGTSLHRTSPKGQSSATSCRPQMGQSRGGVSHEQQWEEAKNVLRLYRVFFFTTLDVFIFFWQLFTFALYICTQMFGPTLTLGKTLKIR